MMDSILVIGRKLNYSGVASYSWKEFSPKVNIADYDKVIIDFTSFVNHKDLLDSFREAQLPRQEDYIRAIFSSNCELIFIGDPGTPICSQYNYKVIRNIPIFPAFESIEGDNLELIEIDYDFYFKALKSWSYNLSPKINYNGSKTVIEGVRSAAESNVNKVTAHVEPIAVTSYNVPIAFRMKLRVRDTSNDTMLSGDYVWLPPLGKINSPDSVESLLRSRFNAIPCHNPPVWIHDYKLPRQLKIEEEIAKISSELNKQTDHLNAKNAEHHDESSYQQLLYTQHEDLLEPIVRKVLESLGAMVEMPKRKGHEDGRILDVNGYNGMLEIKGKTGTLGLRDVRQVDQWTRDALAEEDFESKGILIANTECNISVSERGDPFPDNCKKLAERFHISLLTTSQLFHALNQFQEGTLDQEEFWNKIFSSDGVVPLENIPNV